MNEFSINTFDNLKLSMASADINNPKAVVQIVHGLKEHKKRYYDFAAYLKDNGYAVFMSDNRGHGYSINDDYPLGYMADIHLLVKDQYEITKYIKSKYENTPLYMLGHSYGSMIARTYLQNYDAEISKLILSGTVAYNMFVNIGLLLGKIINTLKGEKSSSIILQSIADNDNISWVCSNTETMAQYKSDPFCTGYKYMNVSIINIFKGMKELHNIKAYKCQNPELKILSITGEKDPVTKSEKGISDSILTLKKAGYKNIENIVYKDMLHEVLNEVDKEQVYKDVLDFIEK